MTVANSIINRVVYLGNGISTEFYIPFSFYSPADIRVQGNIVGTNNITTYQSGVHYSVLKSKVIFYNPVSANIEIIIQRITELSQSLDLRDNDKLHAESLEASLDKLTLIAQDNKNDFKRTIKLPENTGINFNSEIPVSEIQSGAGLVINSDGDGLSFLPDLSTMESRLKAKIDQVSIDVIDDITFPPPESKVRSALLTETKIYDSKIEAMNKAASDLSTARNEISEEIRNAVGNAENSNIWTVIDYFCFSSNSLSLITEPIEDDWVYVADENKFFARVRQDNLFSWEEQNVSNLPILKDHAELKIRKAFIDGPYAGESGSAYYEALDTAWYAFPDKTVHPDGVTINLNQENKIELTNNSITPEKISSNSLHDGFNVLSKNKDTGEKRFEAIDAFASLNICVGEKIFLPSKPTGARAQVLIPSKSQTHVTRSLNPSLYDRLIEQMSLSASEEVEIVVDGATYRYFKNTATGLRWAYYLTHWNSLKNVVSDLYFKGLDFFIFPVVTKNPITGNETVDSEDWYFLIGSEIEASPLVIPNVDSKMAAPIGTVVNINRNLTAHEQIFYTKCGDTLQLGLHPDTVDSNGNPIKGIDSLLTEAFARAYDAGTTPHATFPCSNADTYFDPVTGWYFVNSQADWNLYVDKFGFCPCFCIIGPPGNYSSVRIFQVPKRDGIDTSRGVYMTAGTIWTAPFDGHGVSHLHSWLNNTFVWWEKKNDRNGKWYPIQPCQTGSIPYTSFSVIKGNEYCCTYNNGDSVVKDAAVNGSIGLSGTLVDTTEKNFIFYPYRHTIDNSSYFTLMNGINVQDANALNADAQSILPILENKLSKDTSDWSFDEWGRFIKGVFEIANPNASSCFNYVVGGVTIPFDCIGIDFVSSQNLGSTQNCYRLFDENGNFIRNGTLGNNYGLDGGLGTFYLKRGWKIKLHSTVITPGNNPNWFYNPDVNLGEEYSQCVVHFMRPKVLAT